MKIPRREPRVLLYFTLSYPRKVSVALTVIFLLYLLFLCRTEKELRDVNRLLEECSSQRAKISES